MSIYVLKLQLQGVGWSNLLSLGVGAAVGLTMVWFLPPEHANNQIELTPSFLRSTTKVQVCLCVFFSL